MRLLSLFAVAMAGLIAVPALAQTPLSSCCILTACKRWRSREEALLTRQR
jgi:hypothetical protein